MGQTGQYEGKSTTMLYTFSVKTPEIKRFLIIYMYLNVANTAVNITIATKCI